jgi:type IV secretion system protein VirB10
VSAEGEETVRGERTTAIVHAAGSAHSRVSSVLAAGLMIILGLAALGWYYAHALTRTTQARRAAQAAVTNRAQGEMALPSLGRIEQPVVAPPSAERLLPESQPPEVAAAHVEPPTGGSGVGPVPAAGDTPVSAPAVPPGRGESPRARRLSGSVLARETDSQGARAAAMEVGTPASFAGSAPAAAIAEPAAGHRGGERGDGELAALLHASATPAVPAALLPTQRFLLPEGSFIDCTLETAIDSTLPGMTTCITAADTFGADGKVVLLERGTKLVGETRGQVHQGQARVFVLWTQARTPTGVVVPLASPGTDELGRAGLPGTVERHFWQRFGAAMLITLIDGAVQAGVQASAGGSGTVIYAPGASQEILTEVLKDTVAIPPTVIKHNGDRIQVLVARDLDFRPVYELRSAARGP